MFNMTVIFSSVIRPLANSEVGRSTGVGKGETKTSCPVFHITFRGLKSAVQIILIGNLTGLRNATKTIPYF